MKRIFILVLLSFSLINLAFAQQMSVIDPELYTLMNSKSSDKINVNIILKQQVDVNEQNVRRSFSSREDRRTYMVNEMKTQTEKLQADVLKTLKANERSVQVTDVKCHWLTNMINCNATPDAILKIAEHPDVKMIAYNKKRKVIHDESEKTTAVTRATAAEIATNIAQVNAPQVWNNLGFTGKGVVVAVIDSGANIDHLDLKDHLWTGYIDTNNDGNSDTYVNGWNFISGNSNITDDYGHGTHCAGTVCGDGTSGLATGVAPDAQLMVLKALDDEGKSTVNDVVEAMQWAINNGADVLSVSLGFNEVAYYISDSETFRPLTVNALKAGVVTVAAAGNEGNQKGTYPVPQNVGSPGNCPPPWLHPDQVTTGGLSSVICVGSLNYEATDARAASSEGPVTWLQTSYGDYRLGNVYPTKTLKYDNGTYSKNYHWTTADRFATLFTPSELAEFSDGAVLTSVSIYDALEDAGLFYICQGGNTPSEGTQLHSQTYKHYGSKSMFEIALNKEVTIDKSQNLWVVFQPSASANTIPVSTNTDNPNGRWLDKNGSWSTSIINETVMVRANISTSNVPTELNVGLIRPDVCAPGTDIVSASNTDNDGFSTMSGTSMATPCVAGTIALLLEANPKLTPADICRVLEETAVKVGGATTKSNKTGSGRIDAYNAVLAVATNLPLSAPTLTATAKSSSRIDLSWTIAPGADSYTIYRNGDEIIASGITTTSYSDRNLNPETTYSYKVKAIRGSESVESDAVEATTLSESAAIAGKYRIKVATSSNGTTGKYLHINSTAAPSGSTNVGVSAYTESDNQIFTIEGAGGGNYYLRSENGYYIKCDDQPNANNRNTWNVYAYSTTDKTPVYFDYTGTDGVSFYIRDYDKKVGNGSSSNNLPNNNYFKVENGKIFCNAPSSNTDVVTWILEPVGSSTPTAPATPTGLAATAKGETSIGLTWNAVIGATSYNVYRNDSEIATGLTGTSYTDNNGLTAETNYCYTVTAVNANGESGASNESCATTKTSGSENPEACTIIFTLNDGYGDGWNGNKLQITYGSTIEELTLSTGETGTFKKEIPQGSKLTVKFIGNTFIGENSFTITYEDGREILSVAQGDCANNQNYGTSNIDCAVEPEPEPEPEPDPEPETAPNAPTNLVATAQGTTSIALTWDAVDGATSYNVYRNSSVNPIVNVATGTSYTDTNLTPATNYCYTVKAVNAIGESEASEQKCDETPAEGNNTFEGVVTIGTQSVGKPLPVYTNFNYGYIQQIYTQAEVDPSGTASGSNITKIAFTQSNDINGKTRDIVVYMQNTSKASFTNNSDWVTVTEAEKVYEGTLSISGTNTYYEITLDKPFKYTGENVLIAFLDNSGSWFNIVNFYSYAASDRSIRTGRDASSYEIGGMAGITGTRDDYNTCIDITFVAGSSDPETPSVPDAPQNLAATAQSSTSIALTWSAVDGATSYNVYRNSSVSPIATVATGTSYTDTNLTPATEYVYTVKAVNANGESATSNEARATTQQAPPSAPTNLVATAQGTTSISLTWNAVAGAESYNVYRNSSVNPIATVTTGTSYTDTNLTPATNYCYTVKAVKGGVESAASEQKCAETPAENAAFEGVVTIGGAVNGGVTSGDLPTNVNYNYTFSQQIYTQSEIGVNAGNISKIAFKQNSSQPNTPTRNLKVYMQNVQKTSFANTSDWVSVTDSDKVFEGDVDLMGPGEDFVIELSKPFAYTGGDLLISVYDCTGNYTGQVFFYTYEADARSLCVRNYDNSYNPASMTTTAGTFYSVNNIIDITFVSPSDDNTGGDDLNGEEHLVVIGGVPQYSINELPITTYYNYGYSQQIYTKDEIGINSGTITKIAFKQSNEVTYTRSNVVVYMQNTTKASYTSGSDWVNVTENTKVFEGRLTTPGTDGNLEITLDTPLKYTGENLLISICDNTGSCNTQSSFYIYETDPDRSIYTCNDDASYTSSNMNGSVSGMRDGCNNYIEITIMTAAATEVPSAPANLTATVQSASSIALSWNAVDGVRSYNVYRNGEKIAEGLITTSYTDEGLNPATEYVYTVKAVNSVGESAASNEARATTHPLAPDAPTGLVATAQSTTSIALSWNQVNDATSYNIYRNSTKITSVTTLSYVDNNLTPNTQYCYVVKAVNGVVESEASEEDCETTQSVSVDHNGMEKVVTIGGGTQYESSNLPFNTWYAYSYSQQIYTKAEIDPDGIAVGGKITKIAFKQSNNFTKTREIVVYMQNTNKTSFTGPNNWAAVKAVDKVFDGNVTLPGTGGSLEITLNSPIEYTGGNILISIYDKTNVLDNQAEFYTYSTNVYRALQTQGISCNPETMSGSSITGEIYDSNNSIDFTFVLPVNEYTGSGNWNDASDWEEGLPNSNSNVSVSGDVIINGDVTVKTLVINDGGSVTLESGSLTVTDDFTNTDASAFIINDGAQVFQKNDDVMATFNMNIKAPASWENDHTHGWQFIASPMKDFLSSEFETEGIEYDLFKYDGAQDTQWVNYKRHADTDFETKFYQGRAYLASYETNSKVAFEGTLNHETNYTFSDSVFRAYDEGNHYANFYLLGNPFAFNMDWDNMSVFDMSEGFAVVNLDGAYEYAIEGEIKVGDGFLVRVTGPDPSMTYTSNMRSVRTEKNEFINLVASGKAGKDNVIINFADNGREGFAKLDNFNKEIAEIYVKEDNRRYGILNFENDVEEIDVYFDAKHMGEYTINAITGCEYQSVTLVDLITGNETDLLTSSYTFKSMTNESTARFKLRIERDKENENFVYQTGSDLVIDAEGLVQIVDVMGRIIYSGEQNGVNRVNISNMEKAAYMVRNVNNKEVKVQKIVLF